MKMSEKTLLKKIEQAFAENYCTGSYKLEILHEDEYETYYVLYYTYETGETIAVNIDNSWLGQVKFYSHVHNYYISNFNNHIKSVINVLRMLFDMIDSNKDIMIKYNEIETEESEETEETADTNGEDIAENTEQEETTDTNGEDITENTEPEETEETEETVKDVMEVKQELNRRFGKEQPNTTIIAKIEDINYCPNQNTCCVVSPFVHCDYNYKSEACIKEHKNFIHDCEQVHKQLKAKHNPEWHKVSLATLANIDFDMLDEKLKLYISAYRELKQTISYLRKCKNIQTYDRCYINYIEKQNDMLAKGKFTDAMLQYIRAKLSMQNVESGVWPSDCEDATGFHKSRRYNKGRF